MSIDYRNFLALPYEELEELNLEAKRERVSRVAGRSDPRKTAEVSHR